MKDAEELCHFLVLQPEGIGKVEGKDLVELLHDAELAFDHFDQACRRFAEHVIEVHADRAIVNHRHRAPRPLAPPPRGGRP